MGLFTHSWRLNFGGSAFSTMCPIADIDRIARQLGDLQHLLNKIKEVSTGYGLKISEANKNRMVSHET